MYFGRALQQQYHKSRTSWAWMPLISTLQTQRGHQCLLQGRSHRWISSSSQSTSKENGDDDATKVRTIEGTIPSHGKGLQIGQYSSLHESYSQNDVHEFGTLIGDLNPVHYDEKQHNYEKPIVHGILLSSVFSTIFGTLIPGSIYRSQTLKFQNPVYIDDNVCGKVVITKLKQISRQRSGSGVLCRCDTTVTKTCCKKKAEKGDNNNTGNDDVNGDVLCISGEAQVWLPGATVMENTT